MKVKREFYKSPKDIPQEEELSSGSALVRWVRRANHSSSDAQSAWRESGYCQCGWVYDAHGNLSV